MCSLNDTDFLKPNIPDDDNGLSLLSSESESVQVVVAHLPVGGKRASREIVTRFRHGSLFQDPVKLRETPFMNDNDFSWLFVLLKLLLILILR